MYQLFNRVLLDPAAPETPGGGTSPQVGVDNQVIDDLTVPATPTPESTQQIKDLQDQIAKMSQQMEAQQTAAADLETFRKSFDQVIVGEDAATQKEAFRTLIQGRYSDPEVEALMANYFPEQEPNVEPAAPAAAPEPDPMDHKNYLFQANKVVDDAIAAVVWSDDFQAWEKRVAEENELSEADRQKWRAAKIQQLDNQAKQRLQYIKGTQGSNPDLAAIDETFRTVGQDMVATAKEIAGGSWQNKLAGAPQVDEFANIIDSAPKNLPDPGKFQSKSDYAKAAMDALRKRTQAQAAQHKRGQAAV